LTFGKDPRTYDMAARILNEEVEHEAWFIALLWGRPACWFCTDLCRVTTFRPVPALLQLMIWWL